MKHGPRAQQIPSRSRSGSRPSRLGRLLLIGAAVTALGALLASALGHARIGASIAASINNDANASTYFLSSATCSNGTLCIAFASTPGASGEARDGTTRAYDRTEVARAGLTLAGMERADLLTSSGKDRRIQACRVLAATGRGRR